MYSYFVSVAIDHFIAKSAEIHLLAESYADMFTIDAHALLDERLGLQNYCMDCLKSLVIEINRNLNFSKVHNLSFAKMHSHFMVIYSVSFLGKKLLQL